MISNTVSNAYTINDGNSSTVGINILNDGYMANFSQGYAGYSAVGSTITPQTFVFNQTSYICTFTFSIPYSSANPSILRIYKTG